MLNKLTEFLTLNECLEEFEELLMEDEGLSLTDFVDSSDDPSELVSGGFCWDSKDSGVEDPIERDPRHGFQFWADIDDLWELELDKRDYVWYSTYAYDNGYGLSKHAPKIIAMVDRNNGQCPCKVAGEADETCPCPAHHDEIETDGHCTCNLFIAEV
jgi:hypothetical protein